MHDCPKKMIEMMIASLLLGICGNYLLRQMPWGVNFLIWTIVLTIVVSAVTLRQGIPIAREARRLVLPIIFFAGACAWRDSLTLKFLNLLAVFLIFALLMMRGYTGRLRRAGSVEYSLGIIQTLISAPFVFLNVAANDVPWQEIPGGMGSGKAQAIRRGTLIAIPVILLFGSFLVSADAAFANFITLLFQWNFIELFTNFFWTILITAITGGGLVTFLIKKDPAPPLNIDPALPRLSSIEISIILGTLNLLFITFIIVQFSYFFGGTSAGALSHGLSQAEYARRGFFELVTVSLLVLPLLLVAHWLLKGESAAESRVFSILSGTTVLLLFVIMASALHRMFLYQDAYGLTELRLYTTAFMGWLIFVFAWFSATVLRGKRELFAFGALTAGLMTIAVLDLLNPDAFIARINMGRESVQKQFDATYVTSLSADSVSAVIEALPLISEASRQVVAEKLITSWSTPRTDDWRSWNLGKSSALAALTLHRAELETLCQRRSEAPLSTYSDPR